VLVLLSPFGGVFAGALPACPLKTFTGLPCPSCGATRTALALARLDVPAAFAVSPLATLGWIFVIAGGLAAGAAALAGRAVPELPRRIPWPWRLAAGALVVANWVYLVWHGT
jgi:hypothetical protein